MPHPRFPAAGYDVVVMAASAGGIDAVGRILSRLPLDLPAPIVLVQHLGPRQTTLLDVLQRRSRLPLQWAEQGGRLHAGRVYVAPPDRHLVIGSTGTCLLDSSSRVHSVRPCADISLVSAAHAFGRRTLGVVLTGYGTDGAAGARVVRDAGGAVLVQDPKTCEASAMPLAAIATAGTTVVLPVEAIAPAIASLVGVRGAAQLFGLRTAVEDPVPPPPARSGRAA